MNSTDSVVGSLGEQTENLNSKLIRALEKRAKEKSPSRASQRTRKLCDLKDHDGLIVMPK